MARAWPSIPDLLFSLVPWDLKEAEVGIHIVPILGHLGFSDGVQVRDSYYGRPAQPSSGAVYTCLLLSS